jgi:hypothetical protein
MFSVMPRSPLTAGMIFELAMHNSHIGLMRGYRVIDRNQMLLFISTNTFFYIFFVGVLY